MAGLRLAILGGRCLSGRCSAPDPKVRSSIELVLPGLRLAILAAACSAAGPKDREGFAGCSAPDLNRDPRQNSQKKI